MFREMRRKGQQLSEKEAIVMLEKGTSGVLSLWGDDGYPYGVPISYVYEDNRLFFHSAKQGHKINAIGPSAKASFCVIDQDRIVPEEYTTYFRSVIAFGTIRILSDEEEIRKSMDKLAAKYNPNGPAAGREREISQELGHLCMLELFIEHMTGKESIEIVKTKKCARSWSASLCWATMKSPK